MSENKYENKSFDLFSKYISYITNLRYKQKYTPKGKLWYRGKYSQGGANVGHEKFLDNY